MDKTEFRKRLQSSVPASVLDAFDAQCDEEFDDYTAYVKAVNAFAARADEAVEAEEQLKKRMAERERRELEQFKSTHPMLANDVQDLLRITFNSTAVRAVEFATALSHYPLPTPYENEQYVYTLKNPNADCVNDAWYMCAEKWKNPAVEEFLDAYCEDNEVTVESLVDSLPEHYRNEQSPMQYLGFIAILLREGLEEFLQFDGSGYARLKAKTGAHMEYLCQLQVALSGDVPQAFAEFIASVNTTIPDDKASPVSKFLTGAGKLHGNLVCLPSRIAQTYADGIKESMSATEYQRYTASKEERSARRREIKAARKEAKEEAYKVQQEREQAQAQFQQQQQQQRYYQQSQRSPYASVNIQHPRIDPKIVFVLIVVLVSLFCSALSAHGGAIIILAGILTSVGVLHMPMPSSKILPQGIPGVRWQWWLILLVGCGLILLGCAI